MYYPGPKTPFTLKYYPRLGIYKSSTGNVSFDPTTCEGRSYGWYLAVRRIGGKVVFNNYSYSTTTSTKHLPKLRALLSDLGIKIDLVIHAPKGLQDLNSARQYYRNKAEYLFKEIGKPRTHKSKNRERLAEMSKAQDMIRVIDELEGI